MPHTRTLLVRRTWNTALAAVILAALLLAIPRSADAAPNGYVRMSDGTLMLPVQPVSGGTSFGPEPECGELHEERCVPA